MEDNPYRAPVSTETYSPETVVKRSACYCSTPEHLRRFIGRLYIYTDKGELSLTASSITFAGKNPPPLVFPLDSILHLGVGHYSRWAKPLGLDYISVHHRLRDVEQILLLTPTRSWATATWETNKIVADWFAALEAARACHSHRRSSAQLPEGGRLPERIK
jgi:hypothetical protein